MRPIRVKRGVSRPGGSANRARTGVRAGRKRQRIISIMVAHRRAGDGRVVVREFRRISRSVIGFQMVSSSARRCAPRGYGQDG